MGLLIFQAQCQGEFLLLSDCYEIPINVDQRAIYNCTMPDSSAQMIDELKYNSTTWNDINEFKNLCLSGLLV